MIIPTVQGNFPVEVDAETPMREQVDQDEKNGVYKCYSYTVGMGNIPFVSNTRGKTILALLHLGNGVSDKAIVLREMKVKGLCPAGPEHLLAFARDYSEYAHQFPIIALGSVYYADPTSCLSQPLYVVLQPPSKYCKVDKIVLDRQNCFNSKDVRFLVVVQI